MPSKAPKIAAKLAKIHPRDPQFVPRYCNIGFGRLHVHDARIKTSNEGMMNES